MIPEVTLTIEDGALGALPPNQAGVQVKLGICSKGVPLELQGFSDVNAVKKQLGQGPLVEAIAQVLAVAGGPVYACPINPSVAGSVGSVTHVGPGAGTVTPSLAPDRAIRVKVSTGGALATAAFQFAIDGGEYGAPVVSSAGPWSYLVPGTLCRLTFPAGTYVANDTYDVSVNGGVVLTGTSPAGVTQASSPVDRYEVRVAISTAGTLGTGVFVYSVDGGNNVSPNIAIPSGGGVYAIPGTGVVLTFAGTFVKDDTYSFVTTPAGFQTADVNAAFTAILAQPTEWGFAHVVGAPANAAAAAALAAAVATKMTEAETNFRYVWAAIECPTTEVDSALITAFANFSSARVMVCAGDVGLVSPLTGRTHRRNCAWTVLARISDIAMHVDAAVPQLGPLENVTSLYRNEAATPGLNDQRFTTCRTHVGLQGYYVLNALMMAPAGSDYAYATNRRVMDRACQVVRRAELPFLNSDVRIDTKTGYIDERDAQAFEGTVNAQLRAAVVAPGHASGSTVVMSRTANLLSGSAQPVTVRLVPKAYLRKIETSIGFTNPALG